MRYKRWPLFMQNHSGSVYIIAYRRIWKLSNRKQVPLHDKFSICIYNESGKHFLLIGTDMKMGRIENATAKCTYMYI